MKDPSDDIRDWVYTALNGNVTYGGSAVPVYSFAPKDSAMPYIIISDQSSPGEDSSKDKFISEHDITVEIWTSHTGNRASYVPANTISSSILQLLRTMAVTSSYAGTSFNVIKINMRGLATDVIANDQEVIIYKSLNINLLLEEV